MANEIIREVNPDFFLPDNVKDLTYTELEEGDDDAIEYDVDPFDEDLAYDESPVDAEFPDVAGNPVDTPVVPDGFTIIEQIVRTAHDGSQVVDVHIEVDAGNASEVEMKVAKA